MACRGQGGAWGAGLGVGASHLLQECGVVDSAVILLRGGLEAQAVLLQGVQEVHAGRLVVARLGVQSLHDGDKG